MMFRSPTDAHMALVILALVGMAVWGWWRV